MGRPAKWKRILDAAREEALIATYFYNKPDTERRLEVFLVHMHIAWMYLLQAEFERGKVNYFYRDPMRPTRYVKVDGERKAWDLQKCVARRWSDSSNPVRMNLETTISLRNRVEHRYHQGVEVAAAGFAQALVLNFEEELVAEFGDQHSLADRVHIPISLGTFTRDGAAAMLSAQRALPEPLSEFFVSLRTGLSDVADDKRFEFRVELLQKRAPTTEVDLAITFVRAEDLTPDDLKAYEVLEKSGRVIIREKERAVANLGYMKPKQISALVEQQIPFKFAPSSEFPQAWKYFDVRPSGQAKGRAKRKCKEQYCTFDAVHEDYIYTQAFAELLIAECSTEAGFTKVVGRRPRKRNEVVTRDDSV